VHLHRELRIGEFANITFDHYKFAAIVYSMNCWSECIFEGWIYRPEIHYRIAQMVEKDMMNLQASAIINSSRSIRTESMDCSCNDGISSSLLKPKVLEDSTSSRVGRDIMARGT